MLAFTIEHADVNLRPLASVACLGNTLKTKTQIVEKIDAVEQKISSGEYSHDWFYEDANRVLMLVDAIRAIHHHWVKEQDQVFRHRLETAFVNWMEQLVTFPDVGDKIARYRFISILSTWLQVMHPIGDTMMHSIFVGLQFMIEHGQCVRSGVLKACILATLNRRIISQNTLEVAEERLCRHVLSPLASLRKRVFPCV